MPWTEITRPQYRRDGQRYASDLTEGEWALTSPHLPAPRRLGRPRLGQRMACGREAVPLAVERWCNASELGVIWEVSGRMGSAGIAAAVRLGMAGLFASCMLLGMAESLWARDPSEADTDSLRPDATEKSVHDYTVSLRGAVWLTWVDGKVKDTSRRVPGGLSK